VLAGRERYQRVQFAIDAARFLVPGTRSILYCTGTSEQLIAARLREP